MHLTVGYLATLTGDDGVALAAALAKTFDADVDVVLIVREELPDGHPGRAEYQHLLVERGEEWISSAIGALAAAGVSANSTVLVGESFAESLIDFAEQKNSDLIVIGGARDGIFGGHVIGSVTGALLHRSPIPVALAPRGYAEDPPETITEVTAAVPTRPGPDNPLPFAITLASAARLSIRTVSCRRRTWRRPGMSRSCGRYRWPPHARTARLPLARCPTHPRSSAWWPTD